MSLKYFWSNTIAKELRTQRWNSMTEDDVLQHTTDKGDDDDDDVDDDEHEKKYRTNTNTTKASNHSYSYVRI